MQAPPGALDLVGLAEEELLAVVVEPWVELVVRPVAVPEVAARAAADLAKMVVAAEDSFLYLPTLLVFSAMR